MVKRIVEVGRFLGRSRGYTLIEVMVVLAVSTIAAMMVFYFVQSFNQSQVVVNSQGEFLSNLRALSNAVNNGADGESIKRVDLTSGASSYGLQVPGGGTRTVSLPSGVTLSYDTTLYPGNISICFSNRNLAVFDATHACGPSSSQCASGTGYVCDESGVPTAKSPSSIKLDLKKGGVTKSVMIEGSGMLVNRMYAL